MKRAIVATAGTVAGLVAVLAHTPTEVAIRSTTADSPLGLGGPAPAPATATATGPTSAPPPATTNPATASATRASKRPPSSSRSTARTSAHPASSASPSRTVQPAQPSHQTTAAPAPAPTTDRPPPRSTSNPPPRTTSNPPTSPSKPPNGPQDFIGVAATNKYGTLQVAIRIQGGRIIDAWAVTYPQGPSKPYSTAAIPVLREETIAAQSANIAAVSNASFTSASWVTSLQSALTRAGR